MQGGRGDGQGELRRQVRIGHGKPQSWEGADGGNRLAWAGLDWQTGKKEQLLTARGGFHRLPLLSRNGLSAVCMVRMARQGGRKKGKHAAAAH